MSATLRYDIGLDLNAVITSRDDEILAKLGMYMANRWQGIRHARRNVATFAIRLPKQVWYAYQLLNVLARIRIESVVTTVIARSARVLEGKLTLSLGIPLPGNEKEAEKLFLYGIFDHIEDPANWLIYADWLEENGDNNDLIRAGVIRAWNGKKASKTKYGVIMSAMGGQWSPTKYSF